MRRHEELRQLDIRTRNQLRDILATGGVDAIARLSKLRKSLGARQVVALENILASPRRVKAATPAELFPKKPPFKDTLRGSGYKTIEQLLTAINRAVADNSSRLIRQIESFREIDRDLAGDGLERVPQLLVEHIAEFGWSHAVLRRAVVVRERLESEDDEIERLLWSAGLESNSLVVTSLIHAYASEQNYLTVKRSTLNVSDRGTVNRFSRTMARITFQPFAKDQDDFFGLLSEVVKCSLVDAIIVTKFNFHLVEQKNHPEIATIAELLGDDSVIGKVINYYARDDNESEYLFFKQCGVWLEYSTVRNYRVLVDHFYDASREEIEFLHPEIQARLHSWIGVPKIDNIISEGKITQHNFDSLSKLETSGTVTRSAIFNYWLHTSEGQIGIDRAQLLALMGMTRDLARTAPINAMRVAVKLSNDEEVRLILLLLLAKRSKNEKDNYQLRRLITRLVTEQYNGSLVTMVKSFERNYPDVAHYIYEITTEDFLAKCSGLAPHLSDIPEIRAALHEWMAAFAQDEFYMERARAVRIDHQLNRVRNEIDDHRIYVDPSRFSSWINDEVMVDLNSALTVTGANKKNVVVTCNEALLTTLIQQCYSAFCSNAVFGISSYIGRRIRHGTFRGHLYSGVVNHLEASVQYTELRRDSSFSSRWLRWKERYDKEINRIIVERLHVVSKQKPQGLLQPDNYNNLKLEALNAAVRAIINHYSETKSTEGLNQLIADYCWRLAELDLQGVIAYLKSRQGVLKSAPELDEMMASFDSSRRRQAIEFKREVAHVIDDKLRAMYGWFKRPSNISPKASLALLYDAVVAEVKDSFSGFDPRTESSDLDDIELIGGAYHVLYDSFYVVVFNAAKYGHPSMPVKRQFSISSEKNEKRLEVGISSSIHPRDCADDVAQIIEQRKSANNDDANLYERRSGIPKLMQLAKTCKEFSVDYLGVVGNEVVVRFSYALEH